MSETTASPIVLRRRSTPEQLRYLAAKLREGAQPMMVSAALDMLADEPASDDPLAPVYSWLVSAVGFPYDFTFGEKPPWLDVRRLAAEWHKLEAAPGETVDDWVATILSEAGWDEEGSPS